MVFSRFAARRRANVKDDDVKATFSDGVLKVEIGKGDEPKAKAIQIH
jgi:HSP20 family molecular chaperone IbpA